MGLAERPLFPYKAVGPLLPGALVWLLRIQEAPCLGGPCLSPAWEVAWESPADRPWLGCLLRGLFLGGGPLLLALTLALTLAIPSQDAACKGESGSQPQGVFKF